MMQKNWKFWPILLMFLCIFLAPGNAYAESRSGTCGDNLTWVLDDKGTLTISGEGELDDPMGYREYADEIKRLVLKDGITGIGPSAFANCSNLTGDLIIPDTVKYIDEFAFSYCYSLNGKLKLPSQLERIGMYAFENCIGFTGELQLPDSVKTIGDSAFRFCDGFTGKWDLPENLRSIGDSAFESCIGLTGKLILPDSLRVIGGGAFGSCNITGEVVFPAGVTYIDSVFSGCDGITKVVISEGATHISRGAFAYCNGLTTVTIPSTMCEIGYFAFSAGDLETVYYNGSASAWKKISIGESNEKLLNAKIVYLSISDKEPNPETTLLQGMCGDNLTWKLDKDGTLTISGTGALDDPSGYLQHRHSVTKLVLGKGITAICDRAFQGIENFEGKLTIPDTVKTIGRMAFYRCGFSGDLVIPDSVESIGYGAFIDCEQLDGKLVLSKNLTVIPDHFVSGCRNLKGTLQIPEGVTEIGENAFWSCSGLTGELRLPSTLTNLRKGAFEMCSGLTGTLSFPDGLKVIGVDAFRNCEKFNKLVLHSGITAIESGAFAGCSGFQGKFSIPDSVKTIGSYAFSGCRGLVGEWKIPSAIHEIAEGAFSSCSGLTGKLVIPETVTVIGDSAFRNCTGLTDVSLPESLTAIGKEAFYECTGLTGEVTIPASVKKLGDNAFAYSNVTSLVVKARIETIGHLTFANLKNMDSITLPNSVKKIDEYILGNCPKLKNIYYDGTCCEWAEIEINSRNTVLAERPVFCLVGEVCEEHGFYMPFVDVSPDRFYFVPVSWALAYGITTGTTETTFAPDEGCTRAQVVTFLWRAAGEPEPMTKETNFVDLRPNAFYYKAVLWAVECGITQGTSKDRFSPEEVCTRGQIVTFLYRAAGEPPYNPSSPSFTFDDLREGAFYEDAVRWAAYMNITQGVDSRRFAPDDVCTRGQIVTFLYRFFE